MPSSPARSTYKSVKTESRGRSGLCGGPGGAFVGLGRLGCRWNVCDVVDDVIATGGNCGACRWGCSVVDVC